MGLREAVQAGVKAGTGALGNLRTEATYEETSPGDYNASTDTKKDIVSKFVINNGVVLLQYKFSEIKNSIKLGDQKALFAQSNLSVIPKIDAVLILPDGAWEIKGDTKDPADASWILQIRKVKL